MIKSITVINQRNESTTFELGHPEKSGFLVQSIDGLGPPKASINSTNMASNDGSRFNSARIDTRNIVLKLQFIERFNINPYIARSIEDIRQMSYKYFPIKESIRLIVETSDRTYIMYGYVESNEPVIFSKEEMTQISIICPDPYIYHIDVQSAILTDEPVVIDYQGDIEIGMVIRTHITQDVMQLRIYDNDTNEQLLLTPVATSFQYNGDPIYDGLPILINGDDLHISTVKGNKYIKRVRNGVEENFLNHLSRNSTWLQLRKGITTLKYSGWNGLADISGLEFTVDYNLVYEGV